MKVGLLTLNHNSRDLLQQAAGIERPLVLDPCLQFEPGPADMGAAPAAAIGWTPARTNSRPPAPAAS